MIKNLLLLSTIVSLLVAPSILFSKSKTDKPDAYKCESYEEKSFYTTLYGTIKATGSFQDNFVPPADGDTSMQKVPEAGEVNFSTQEIPISLFIKIDFNRDAYNIDLLNPVRLLDVTINGKTYSIITRDDSKGTRDNFRTDTFLHKASIWGKNMKRFSLIFENYRGVMEELFAPGGNWENVGLSQDEIVNQFADPPGWPSHTAWASIGLIYVDASCADWKTDSFITFHKSPPAIVTPVTFTVPDTDNKKGGNGQIILSYKFSSVGPVLSFPYSKDNIFADNPN